MDYIDTGYSCMPLITDEVMKQKMMSFMIEMFEMGISLMREELSEIKTEFAVPRRTVIDDNEYEHDIEDLIAEEGLVLSDNVNPEIDVLFLCLGHGNSSKFLEKHSFSSQTKMIDLSNDFRDFRKQFE